MDEVFGRENFRNEIIVTRGEYPKGEVNRLRTGNDNIMFYAKSNRSLFYTPRKERKERKWVSMHLAGQRSKYELQIREFFGRKLLPPKGRHWMLSQEKINELIEKGEIRINENKEYIDLQGNLVKGEPEMLQSEFEILDSNWTDIQSYSVFWSFKTENSEILLKRVIECTSNEGDLVMDFFLGSGTTTAV
ncbi:MAG: site-specific DNA-methyltransferase, partial [Candidatus Pacearchaeota archaeon]|nr:site-specific DNA-methyltransferase [Candidatus Pacearchaeota archaeon]